MASAKKKQRKNGSFFYEISVSRGYSKSPYTMRWDVPEGLAAKTVKARLRDVAAKFEQDCKNGKVKTRKERKEELQQAELKRILDEKNRMTFKRYCEETFLPDIRQRCSENTIYNYRLQLEKHIYPDIGQLEMQGIKAGDINQLLRKQQAASDSLSTPIKVYTIVRAVMKMAYKDELIEHNPMDRVDRPSKRKDLSKAQSSMSCTVDEIQKLCKALKTEPILWQALVRLLIDSGMRIGECVGLLWSNVDFDKARITVDGTLVYSPDKGVFRDRTKNGKSREFGIDPDIIKLLKVLKEKQKLTEESEYVFTNEQTGKPLHPDSPRRYLKKLGEKCGIKGIHPHMLRHSFASIAITSGADIASVSEKLGHSDKAVTLRMYTHADAVSIDKASETYRDAIKPKKNDADNKRENTPENDVDENSQRDIA